MEASEQISNAPDPTGGFDAPETPAAEGEGAEGNEAGLAQESLGRLEARMDKIAESMGVTDDEGGDQGLTGLIDYTPAEAGEQTTGEATQQAQAQPQQAEIGQPADPGLGDADTLSNDAMQQLNTMIDQRVESQIQERVQPFMQNQTERELTNELQALESEHPELKDPNVAKPVLDAAEAWAKGVGDPTLAYQPTTLKMVYDALKGSDALKRAGASDDGDEVSVEGAGKASPQPEGNADLAQLVRQAGKPDNNWNP